MASLPPPRCSANPSGTDVFDTSAATAMHDALTHNTTPASSSSLSRSRSACSTPSSLPTNAFEGLVAWFCSRDIHPTAKYAWTFHKGTLASLAGIESGEQPVDVIFAQAGDPMLPSLHNLSIPILNPAYIHASLNKGELLAILPFQIKASTSNVSRPKNRALIASRSTVAVSRNIRDVRKDSVMTLPPSPESLQVQGKVLSQSEISRRGSVLSPKRPAIAHQVYTKSFQPKKFFACHGTCPELTCEHRTDLRIHKTFRTKESKSPFLGLTGYSPSTKKHPSEALLRLVKQEEPTEVPLQLTDPVDESLSQRLAKIKSEIGLFKSPIQYRYKSPNPTVRGSLAKSHDKRFLRYQETPVKAESRSPYAFKENDSKCSLDQAAIEAYRKEFLVPTSIFNVRDEGIPVENIEETLDHNLPMIKPRAKIEEEDGPLALYQHTPLSLKRKPIQSDLNYQVDSSPSRAAKRIKDSPRF